MDNQFTRTETLIGKEALEKLKNSRVAVFGLGGVGGYVVEALVRAGVRNIDLIDNDDINITNINRQIIALHSTIGKPKVDVVKARVLDINPEVNVKTYKTFFAPETSSSFDFSKYDYVVDAIDSVTGKIELVLKTQGVNVPIISCLGTGNKLHPEMFEITDIYKTSVCPLAKVMRKLLKENCEVTIYSDSAYVCNAITEKWLENWQLTNWKNSQKKPVSNKELWLELLDLIGTHNVQFVKVKGHADNIYNNKCDELARAEILKLN